MISYGAAISAYGKDQLWQQALHVFMNLEADVITYGAAISAFGLGFSDCLDQGGALVDTLPTKVVIWNRRIKMKLLVW